MRVDRPTGVNNHIRHPDLKDDFCNKQTPGTYHSRKEFFLDSDGILYRHRSNGNHQLVVPATLVQEVMKENHAPVYIAHSGTKRTHDLIALQYWWPGMRKAIEEYARSYDPCQRKKEDREFVAPLGFCPKIPRFKIHLKLVYITPVLKSRS
jgi:hypothetical protein